MPAPTISVIIPTMNEAPRLARLLAELQRVPQLEIIVTDGGSTDGTATIAQQSGVRLVAGPAGRGRQLNRGAAMATGEILLFLHADSQLDLTGLAQLQQAVAAGSQWGCFTLTFDDPGLFFRLVAWGSNLRVRLFSSCYGDQGIFCRRDLWQQLGGFPNYPFLEDLAFSRQARQRQKATLLKTAITTSARRFKKHGPFQTLWRMQMVKILYALGLEPEQLLPYYRTGQWRSLFRQSQGQSHARSAAKARQACLEDWPATIDGIEGEQP